MELALIRHTRCDVLAGTCYGHLDVSLASTAAADIALTLSRVPPVDLVFCSPSQRCHSLAKALAARDACEIRTRTDLRELNFGSWEGLRWHDIPRTLSDAWAADPWNSAAPGGESESQLWQRVTCVANELLQLDGVKRIAVVSHGGPLRHLRCLLTGAPAGERWSWSIECGEVAVIAPVALVAPVELIAPVALTVPRE
jgi:alpha-ribazole phosphatase